MNYGFFEVLNNTNLYSDLNQPKSSWGISSSIRVRLRAGLCGGLQRLQHIMMSNGKLLGGAAKESCEHFYILFRSGPQSSGSEGRGEQAAQIPPTPQAPSSRASRVGALPERPELSLYVMLFRRGHGAPHETDGSETASAGLRPAFD